MLAFLRTQQSSLYLFGLSGGNRPALETAILLQGTTLRPADPTLSVPSNAPYVCPFTACWAAYCPTHNPLRSEPRSSVADLPMPEAPPSDEGCASDSGLTSSHSTVDHLPSQRQPSTGIQSRFTCYSPACEAMNCPEHGKNNQALRNELPRLVLLPTTPIDLASTVNRI